MTTILTTTEAAAVLRCDPSDTEMINLLPIVDAYIIRATGHDWTADAAIDPVAKAAARMLLVNWHENPGVTGISVLSFGANAALTQLEAKAAQYQEFRGAGGAGYCPLEGAEIGDTVVSVTGLVGITGDQSANFESVITVCGYIKQLSNSNWYWNWFRAYLKPVEEL